MLKDSGFQIPDFSATRDFLSLCIEYISMSLTCNYDFIDLLYYCKTHYHDLLYPCPVRCTTRLTQNNPCIFLVDTNKTA